MSRTTTQWRVTYTRGPVPDDGYEPRPTEDLIQTKTRGSRKSMEKLLLLLGPEPWKAYTTKDPDDDYACCAGYECGCGGKSVREESEERRKNLPPARVIKVECRTVRRSAWAIAEADKVKP